MNRTYEEKETDVRIATQVVADTFRDMCDTVIIVSADSDMIPALELVKEEGKRVFVFFPPNQFTNSMAQLGSGKPVHLQNYARRFRRCLFPDVVVLKKSGYHLHIPAKWKAWQKE